MRDENRVEVRQRIANGIDMRIDSGAGIEDDVIVDQIRARAVEREWAGIRRGDRADPMHSGMVAQPQLRSPLNSIETRKSTYVRVSE